MSLNPYQPPQAEVADFQPPSAPGRFLGQPRRVAGANGARWFKDAWQLILANPVLWVVAALIVLALILAAQLPPSLGLMLQYLLFPLALATLSGACDGTRRGEANRFGELFALVAARAPQLTLAGVLYLAGIILIALLVMVPLLGWDGLSVLYGEVTPAQLREPQRLMLAMLLLVGLSLPLFMAIWFAPSLILLHGQSAASAMVVSFAACVGNLWPFLIYGVVGLGLSVLASLPFFLGWLVLLPVFMVTAYSSYRDLFFES